MRLSSSSTLIVGATQPDSAAGMAGMPAAAPLARFCRKSKPGTKRPKPKGVVSLMAAPMHHVKYVAESLPLMPSPGISLGPTARVHCKQCTNGRPDAAFAGNRAQTHGIAHACTT